MTKHSTRYQSGLSGTFLEQHQLVNPMKYHGLVIISYMPHNNAKRLPLADIFRAPTPSVPVMRASQLITPQHTIH